MIRYGFTSDLAHEHNARKEPIYGLLFMDTDNDGTLDIPCIWQVSLFFVYKRLHKFGRMQRG